MHKRRLNWLLMAFVLGLFTLVGFGSATSLAKGAEQDAVPEPTYTRPLPRPLPTTPAPPAPTSPPTPVSPMPPPSQPAPEGGFIELHIQSARALQLWTGVQWQDGIGGWHDVDGWQGEPDQENKVTWWVNKADLGKGPFRWMVYQGQGGNLLAVSEAFRLPSCDGEIVRIQLSITFR